MPWSLAYRLSPFIRLLQSLLNRLPVDDIPDRRKVLGLAVLVLQVVGVLPRIDTQERGVLAHHRVLVGVCPDLHLARLVILHEPRPATALDAGQRGVEFGLE